MKNMNELLLRATCLSPVRMVMVSLGVVSLGSTAYALPQDANVVGGNLVITQTDKRIEVTQHTNKGAIDWRSFDIGADEEVRFKQPSANAATLNRVTGGGGASQINGRINANGKVVLINPNGMVFGQGAKVNVGGLLATTADIDPKSFIKGDNHFSKAGNPDAIVVNDGSITAKDAGLVGLVAPHVENHGQINAKMGRVTLAGGDTFAVDLYGDGLISLGVNEHSAKQLVRNTGSITAAGSDITITAAQGSKLVENLVEVQGELLAPSIQQHGSKITISGSNADVTLQNAKIDASGAQKAGSVLIGGDVQGSGTTPRARNTRVENTSVITANATHKGDGGKIIVWADGNTNYAGHSEAQGGVKGGNGGFVEVSGKHKLTFNGTANTSAPKGKTGTLLLDPQNITIANAGDITPAAITTALASNDVVIHTKNTGLSQNGDITVSDSVNYTSANGLTLLATRNINANASIQNNGSGAVNLVAGWDEITANPGGTAGTAVDPSGTFNIAAITGLSSSYGNNNGSIFINNSASTALVSVGSRHGKTTTAAYNTVLSGGSVSNSLAQIGFFAPLYGGGNTTGDIEVNSANNTQLISGAGSGFSSLAFIGQDGNNGATISGNILLNTKNLAISSFDTTIGATGDHSDGTLGSQVGHYIWGSPTTTSGNITVNATDISIAGSSYNGARIGHASSAGNTTNFHNLNGDITVNATNNLFLDYTNAGVQIGHGNLDQASGARSGNILLKVGGELTVEQGFFQHSIGHTTSTVGGLSNANIRIIANSLDFADDTVDPNDFNLNNVNFSNRMVTNLAGGDVTIASTNAPITLGSDIAYSSTHHFNLLSYGDIRANTNIQNNGAGTVNLISGWDSTHGLNADGSVNIATITGNNSYYGNNNGSIFINNAAGTQRVSVGSKNGATNVLGYDINVTAPSDYDAQLGYFSAASNSPISVYARRNITLTGSPGGTAYTTAHIGHGGVGTNNNQSGDILIRAGGNLSLTGGAIQGAVTKIGHSTLNSDGSHSGTIDVNVAGDVSVVAGNAPGASAAIGHGGDTGGSGSKTGDIAITARNISVTASNPIYGFAQIGHVLVDSSGATASGKITVNADNLSLTGGGTSSSIAQIGHGGENINNSAQGDINITLAQNLLLKGGSSGYAQIGHGAAGGSSDGTRQGNILVKTSGEVSLANSQWLIGHNTNTVGGLTNANIRIVANSLDFADDAPDPTSFILNNTNFASRMVANVAGGDVTIASKNAAITNISNWSITSVGDRNLNLLSYGNLNINQNIIHNGIGGRVNVIAGWDGVSGLNPSNGTIDFSTLRLRDTTDTGILTIAATKRITVGATTGTGIIAAAADRFTSNNVGNSLVAASSRYVIYSTSGGVTTLGTLAPTAIAGGYNNYQPSGVPLGNHIVYDSIGALTLLVNGQSYTYTGAPQLVATSGAAGYGTYYNLDAASLTTLTGAGYTLGNFTSSLTGNATFSVAGGDSTTVTTGRDIVGNVNTLLSSLGYDLSFNNTPTNELTIAAVTPPAPPPSSGGGSPVGQVAPTPPSLTPNVTPDAPVAPTLPVAVKPPVTLAQPVLPSAFPPVPTAPPFKLPNTYELISQTDVIKSPIITQLAQSNVPYNGILQQKNGAISSANTSVETHANIEVFSNGIITVDPVLAKEMGLIKDEF